MITIIHSGGASGQAATVDENRSSEANAGACAVSDTNSLLPDADIPVDEALFTEDDPIVNADKHELTDDVERLKLVGMGEEIAVDEALFDVDNLGDLDLDDPSLLPKPPAEDETD